MSRMQTDDGNGPGVETGCCELEAPQVAAASGSELIAILTHELRTPLAAMVAALAVLERANSQSEQEHSRQILHRQLQQVTRLVDDAQDLCRLDRGGLRLLKERTDLCQIVLLALDATQAVISARRHRLRVKTPSEPVMINGDPARLAQVMTNLVNNAAKYTPEAGEIEVTLERQEREIIVRVSDNGIGISADMLDRVFDSFKQGRRARTLGVGLGIGLGIVKKVVELHAGRVRAASDGPGCGSVFTITLPFEAV